MMIEFQVGDLVTRDGTDVHRVIEVENELITVECVKEPLGFLNDDGTRDTPWARIGERETNLARRYTFAGQIIDDESVSPGTARETDYDYRRRLVPAIVEDEDRVLARVVDGVVLDSLGAKYLLPRKEVI